MSGNKVLHRIEVFILLYVGLSFSPLSGQNPDFISLDTLLNNAQLKYSYFGRENFTGKPVKGYHAKKILLTRKAGLALKKVEKELEKIGLGLIVFDGYRPQQAVDNFVGWSKDLDDTLKKSEYYPNLSKKRLFGEGYIAEQSGHSRGSTVDVSLYRLSDGKELDMGTRFDFFDPLSHPTTEKINEDATNNRLILRKVMLENGFLPLSTEWWHFTLKDEPFPGTYFDFPID